MLGDSLRRRKGSGGKPPRPPKSRRGRGLGGWRGWGGSGGPLGWGPGRWALTVVALIGVCFGVGYLLALYVLFPVPAEAAAGVPMPDVVSHTLEQARATVEKAGLTIGALDTLNGSQAPGTVVAQAPLPGQQLRAGAAVDLAISAGPAPVRVPPLRGMTRADAVAMLDSLGLASASDGGLSPLPVGQIARSTPDAGAAVARGDTVHLTVSEGPPVIPTPTPGLDTTSQPVPPGGGMPGGGERGP